MDDAAAGFLAAPPADPRVTAAYRDDLASDGYVANLTRVWCWRPDVMVAFQELRAGLLAGSSLSEREVAVLVSATAATLGDAYCALAWGRRLADAAGEATAAAVLRGADAGLSDREAALAAWSRRVVRDPNTTTAAAVDELRRAGLADREIFEATAWIAFRLAFSTVNDALGAPPDPELVAQAPPLVRAAVHYGRPA